MFKGVGYPHYTKTGRFFGKDITNLNRSPAGDHPQRFKGVLAIPQAHRRVKSQDSPCFIGEVKVRNNYVGEKIKNVGREIQQQLRILREKRNLTSKNDSPKSRSISQERYQIGKRIVSRYASPEPAHEKKLRKRNIELSVQLLEIEGRDLGPERYFPDDKSLYTPQIWGNLLKNKVI